MIKLNTPEALETARTHSQSEPVILYKHSATCGISTLARREVATLASAEKVPVYEIVVQTARSISDGVEQTYGIRHESPQVIVLYRDRPVFHASHGRIRALDLGNALADAVKTSAES